MIERTGTSIGALIIASAGLLYEQIGYFIVILYLIGYTILMWSREKAVELALKKSEGEK